MLRRDGRVIRRRRAPCGYATCSGRPGADPLPSTPATKLIVDMVLAQA